MGTLRSLVCVGLFLLPAIGAADEIYLRGGGKVTGVIAERTKDTVSVETGPGRVTLPMTRVERIVDGRSALEAYRERAAALATRDVDGWARLARWAAESDLQTQSHEAWQRVLAFDPGHPEANAAMGRTLVDGTWMPSDEAYRARGYVPFEGRWVTPAEQEALVRERVAEDAAEQQRREHELRVREAEARAREAEARASEAEAAAMTPSAETEGIPYWWVLGGGGRGFRPHPMAHLRPFRPPVVVGRPPMTTTPASIGATHASAPATHGAAPGLPPPPKSPKSRLN
jgi:hypothetical protein